MTGAAAAITIATTTLTGVIMYGATARLTRLVTEDTITAPIRTAIMGKWGPRSKAYAWIGCPWCVGLWIAYAVALAVFAGEHLSGQRLVLLPAWLWVPLAPLVTNYYAARAQTQ